MGQVAFPSLLENLEVYVQRIESLRSRAAVAQRQAYTVVLGQLLACDLITRERYDQAMAVPQEREPALRSLEPTSLVDRSEEMGC